MKKINCPSIKTNREKGKGNRWWRKSCLEKGENIERKKGSTKTVATKKKA